MIGHAGYNSTVSNNGAESTWKHIKDLVKRNRIVHINVFIKSLFGHLKFKGQEEYASSEFNPYSFPKLPRADADTWRQVQK